jgi:hypothetical protein
MSDVKTPLSGPDLAKGTALSGLADGSMLLGHVRGEPVLLARHGSELFVAVIHRDLEGLRAEVELERAAAARPPTESSRP